MLGLAIVPCVLHVLIGLILRLESPKWLLLKKGEIQARKMLQRLRDEEDTVNLEIEELLEEISGKNQINSGFFFFFYTFFFLHIFFLHFFFQIRQQPKIQQILFENQLKTYHREQHS